MKTSLRAFVAWLGCLVVAIGARAQGGELVPGQLVERVVCAADGGQSYAVNLPSNYQAGREWPILYCFDPRGNGKRPVRIAQAAAERHGFIVVGRTIRGTARGP